VGYYFFQQQDQWWFREVLAELNVFRNPATLTGTVWQYQLAQFNNYTYSAPLTSTRLMFDIKPAFNFTNFFAYPILGVGVAWNNLAYHETVKPTGIPNSALSLSRNVRSNFAYEVGIGLGIDISPTITAKLEYLYAHIGKATPSSTSKNVALQSPPTFSLSSQVLMVGFSWQFAKEMP
jgi:opacity protein-like surface antigen